MQENQDNIQVFKPDLIPVDKKEGWFRDPDSHAVVNCNKSQYDQYMASFNKREKKEKQFTSLQTDVDGLKLGLNEIKSLLKQIIVNGENNAS